MLAACTLVASTLSAQDSPPAAAPAPAGTCIAMALPTVKGAEDATQMATAVRDLFTSYLQGPSIKMVALDARLAVQATEEAKQKSCNHMLVASVTRRRGGGGGALGRAIAQAGSTAAWYAPVGSVGTAVARGAVIAGAQAAADIATTTKAKDELRIEYRLVSTDGRVIVKPKEERAKASVDGEDLLTPLVQTVSESIASAVIKN
jgi:hypothetical protein